MGHFESSDNSRSYGSFFGEGDSGDEFGKGIAITPPDPSYPANFYYYLTGKTGSGIGTFPFYCAANLTGICTSATTQPVLNNQGANNTHSDAFLARFGVVEPFPSTPVSSEPIVQESKSVILYPNPSNGIISAKFENFPVDNYTIQIIGIDGKIIVLEVKFIESTDAGWEKDISTLPRGIYIFRIEGKQEFHARKIVKL